MILQTPKQRQNFRTLTDEERIRQLMLSKDITLEEARKIIESKQKSISDFKF